MKDIYYVNSNNEKIDLLEPPYMLQTGELFGSKWSYESKQRLGGGGKITNIRKDLEERTLTLSIVNYGVENYEEAIDYLHEITDIDVLKKTPGRLSICEWDEQHLHNQSTFYEFEFQVDHLRISGKSNGRNRWCTISGECDTGRG